MTEKSTEATEQKALVELRYSPKYTTEREIRDYLREQFHMTEDVEVASVCDPKELEEARQKHEYPGACRACGRQHYSSLMDEGEFFFKCENCGTRTYPAEVDE